MSAKSKEECAAGVWNPKVTKNSLLRPKKGEDITLIKIQGPGVFVAAEIRKQSSTGSTLVRLVIDGRPVVDETFSGAKSSGLSQSNPFGIVLLKTDGVDNFTIGFPTTLSFEKELVLSIRTDEDLMAIVSSLVHGSA
jgi:hypothetical protein